MQAPIMTSTTATEPGGRTITETQSRTVTLTDPANPLTVATQTETTTGPNGTTTTVYQASDHSLTMTTPGGSVNKVIIDNLGRITSTQEDPKVAPDLHHYDSNGNLDQQTVTGMTTNFTYDHDGRVLTATTATGTQQYVYNDQNQTVTTTSPAGRVYVASTNTATTTTKLTNPDGGTDTASTTSHGELTSFTTTGQSALTFSLDSQGLPATVTFPSGTAVTTSRNAAEQVTAQSAGGTSDSYTYNNIGETTTATHNPGNGGIVNSSSLTWNGLDLTKITNSGTAPAVYTYTYDAQGRLASYQIGNQTAQNVVRNSDDLLTAIGPTSIDRLGPAGSATSITDGLRTETRTYDSYGRLATRAITVAGSPIVGTTYNYSTTTGQLTTEQTTTSDQTTIVNYTYDKDGWLTSSSTAAGPGNIDYDADGNRQADGSLSATFAPGDRISSSNGQPCTENANGDVTSCNGNTYAYGLNSELTAATTPSGNISYSYDSSGRLIERTGKTGTTQFLYANLSRPLEVSAIIAGTHTIALDYDDHGHVIAYHDGSATTYVVTDARGTPTEYVDSAGDISKAPSRDPFGRRTAQGATPIPIGFASGLEDNTTGIVTLGARAYDPATARWLQPDPSLLGGGDSDLYRYAANDPVDLVDTTGLAFTDWQDWNLAPIGNFAAGFGNAITFGLTNFINRLTGADNFVDHCSTAYELGMISGVVFVALFASVSASIGAAAEITEATEGLVGTAVEASQEMELTEAAESYAELDNSGQRAVESLQDQIDIHSEKLDAYQQDPFANDNLGILERAPTAQIRDSIIEGRMNHLEAEIRAFRGAIRNILGM